MIDTTELFVEATIPELKRGYVYDNEQYVCLACGQCYEEGVIYPGAEEGLGLTAEKKMKLHVHEEHQSMFHVLLGMSKKQTGLTELQKELMGMFYEGLSDNEVVKRMGAGSGSTIRNHRFTLREKMKQAKLFLTMMEMLEDHNKHEPKWVPVYQAAPLVDERFAVTEEEQGAILQQYFKDGLDGKLSSFPKKEKRKVVILRHLLNRFERGRVYTEKEANEILKTAQSDYVTLRRYLIEYGLMSRKDDGSQYWLT
ncbi:DUF2087 domain-containing protein [Paenibacillus marinisediminis]